MPVRFDRFGQTLTKRQALPPALLARSPVSMNFEVAQDYPSNGLGVRPWSNNRLFPEGNPDPPPVDAPPSITGVLPTWTATQNTAVQTFDASIGFSGANLVYALEAPIPTGVSINASSGLVSADTVTTGTGSKTINIKASNAGGVARQVLTLSVTNPIVPPAKVNSLPDWTVQGGTGNVTYNASIGFTGATITYTLQTGATGVSINATTGVLTANTATVTAGPHALVVRATNGAGFVEQNLLLTLNALAAPVKVGTLSDLVEQEDTGIKTYNAAVGFAGQQIVYSLITPPAGVTVNSSSGLVSIDTVNPLAITLIKVRATNSAGFVEQTFNLTIQAAIVVLPKAATLADDDFNMLGTMFDPAFPSPSTKQTGVIEIPVGSAAINSDTLLWGSVSDVPMLATYIGHMDGGSKLFRCNSPDGRHMKDPLDFYSGIYVYHRQQGVTDTSLPSTATARFTVPALTDKVGYIKPTLP